MDHEERTMCLVSFPGGCLYLPVSQCKHKATQHRQSFIITLMSVVSVVLSWGKREGGF